MFYDLRLRKKQELQLQVQNKVIHKLLTKFIPCFYDTYGSISKEDDLLGSVIWSKNFYFEVYDIALGLDMFY